LTGGVLSADVIISSSAGNALQLLPDGLFVPATSSISVQDTNSVDLTLTGGVVSADVIISPNTGNQLQLLSNGLYVPPSTFNLNVVDTSTVDLNFTGGTLTANVIVSPNTGNALQVLSNGLFVPSSSISVQDTNSVDLTLTGGVLSANVIVSPNTGNQLQVLSNGLYVPPSTSSFSVLDTSTIDLDFTNNILRAFARISNNPNNALTDSNGLFVPAYRDCNNNLLGPGARLLRCPVLTQRLNFNRTLISTNQNGGTDLLEFTSRGCPRPDNADYIIMADVAGDVSYTRMSEAIFHNLTQGNPIVFPNLALVNLQSPFFDTGAIDSASFTNTRRCYAVFPKGQMTATLQHSLNQNNVTNIATARISNIKSLVSRIDNYNTPGITGTPLNGQAWRNETISATDFSADRIIELGPGIGPNATAPFLRSVTSQGGIFNRYYITVEDWSATINIFAL